MMRVKFFDWSAFYLEDRTKFLDIIDTTLASGGFILQEAVENFEANLCRITGAKYAIGLADGTNAILLGLRASNLRVGDEVILSGHSFIAAAQSIHHAGGMPVPVELNIDDWLICTKSISRAITHKTKAIMPVHVNGRICEMEAINSIAQEYGLEVYEDAAQALGAKYKGVSAGLLGRWGTFSFYPSKTLGCFGDAGALITNDEEIYDKVYRMRNHGAGRDKSIETDINFWGTNCRLDNVQAAILNYKLNSYEAAVKRRREIAKIYHDALADIDIVQLPPRPDDNHQYDVYQNFEFCTEKRDELRKFLKENGVDTIIQWGGFGIHELTNLGIAKRLPKTDKFFQDSLLLPLNHILSDEQVNYVVHLLRKFYG